MESVFTLVNVYMSAYLIYKFVLIIETCEVRLIFSVSNTLDSESEINQGQHLELQTVFDHHMLCLCSTVCGSLLKSYTCLYYISNRPQAFMPRLMHLFKLDTPYLEPLQTFSLIRGDFLSPSRNTITPSLLN